MAEPRTAWVPRDTFGSRLVLARRDLHISQEEAARRCGINGKTWATWEGPRARTPSDLADVVHKIVEGLGVDRDWLMWGGRLEPVFDLTLPSGESDQARSGSGWCRVTPDQLQFAGLESVGHFDDEPIDLTDAADPRRMVTPGVTSGARRQGRAAA